MTTLSIPTAARGKVRAFIKSHARFPQWLAAKGIASRDVRNEDLLSFAEIVGILPEVQTLISSVQNAPREPALDREFYEAMAYEGDKQREHKADIAADAAAAIADLGGEFRADDILKDVEQFLSPLVKGELEKALAPLIDAANKPAVEVEVVREVMVDGYATVQAPARPKAPAQPSPVRTGQKVRFNKLFGTQSSHAFGQREITLWNSHGLAPKIDPFYVVNAETMAAIATAAETKGQYVWQVGPSGSGKSTQPEQFAAYTGRRFFRFTCTKQSEVADFIGGDGARNGNTFWKDGGVIAAMRIPGAVILIDEPTLTSPGVQAIFQAVTDDSRKYTIHATGEVVQIADGVIFIVADNTNGAGDETGQYAGTHQSNAALVNRFHRMVRVDYMSKKQEAAALVNHTNIPQPAAEHVVDFFVRARKLPEMEGVVMSLRQMVGFVHSVKDGFNSASSFDMAVLNKLPATERAAVQALATLDWHSNFELLLAGQSLTNAPSSSAAAQSFNDDASF